MIERDKNNPAANQKPLDEEQDETVSKSERKRQMHRLQALGEALVDQKPDIVATLNPSTTLIDALDLARITKKREALRRQLQYIGKLMRAEEPDFIVRAEVLLNNLQAHRAQQKNELHLYEAWRDRLLADPSEAIEDFIREYPAADRQWLRQICRQHAQEIAANRPVAASRKLFAYIRDTIQASMPI